jgi:hypothetical protein
MPLQTEIEGFDVMGGRSVSVEGHDGESRAVRFGDDLSRLASNMISEKR